jgi:DNA-binding winged helix-turn-helix (wHTH) protein/tetratricopeptide (TPR) repeat protein
LEKPADKRRWRFGSCSVDASRRELRRDGAVVDMQPRVFDLLVCLLENHDRAVGKDELQDAVWPGMFITETALTRAVMKARKAVGDDASRQDFIKTVHGHGYRFVAELTPEAHESAPVVGAGPEVVQAQTQAPPAPEPAGQGTTAPPASPRQHWRTLALGTLAAVLVASLVWVLLRPPATLGADNRVAVLPLLDVTGDPEMAWTRLGLMSYASSLMGADGSLPVVSEGSVIGLVDHLRWTGALEDPANAKLIAKLREAYGASHLLAMRLEREGRALRMNFGLLGPDGAVQRGTIVGDQGTDLAQGVVQSVYGTLLGKRRLGREVPLVSADPFNNEAFARGMDFSLQGRCSEALPFFRLIIEQERDLFAPRFEYASCLRILGKPAEAESLLDELIAEQRNLDPARPLAQALMIRGVLYNRTGRLDEAEAAHDEALRVAESIGDRELAARILQNLAIVFEDRGDFRQAEELLDLSHLRYRDAGREVMPGQLWANQANLQLDQGQLLEARELFDKALEAFRGVGDRRNEAMMLNNTGLVLRNMGRLEEAEGYHLRSLEIRQQIGDRVGVGRVYNMLGMVYAGQGRYAEAMESSKAALEIARETQDRLFEATSLTHLGEAEQATGDVVSARQHYAEARTVFADIQDSMRVLQSDLRLARLDLEGGEPGLAETTALQVLDSARGQQQVQPEIEALELLGDIRLVQGDSAAAAAEFEAALARIRDASWGAKESNLLSKLAELHLAAGDLAAAAPLVGALGGHEPTVQSLKAQARFAWAQGDATRAVQLLEQARERAGEAWNEEGEELLASWRAE